MNTAGLRSRRSIPFWILNGVSVLWKAGLWLIERGGDLDFVLSLRKYRSQVEPSFSWVVDHGYWLCLLVGMLGLAYLASRDERRRIWETIAAGERERPYQGDAPDENSRKKDSGEGGPGEYLSSGTREVFYQGDKVALAGNIESLLEPFERQTARDLRSYVQSKIGCWLPVAGLVRDISENLDLTGKTSGNIVSLMHSWRQAHIVCDFGPADAAAVRPLGKRDQISLIGQIARFDEISIGLRNCVRLREDGTEVVPP